MPLCVGRLLSASLPANRAGETLEDFPARSRPPMPGFCSECPASKAEAGVLCARVVLRAPAGAPEGPTLCYLGHVDTGLADASEWTRDPWSGDIAGSTSQKNTVASEPVNAR